MSEPTKHDEVHCRRIDRKLPPEEHADCPYCYGKKKVEGGEHAEFCDFEPDKDPIVFGFPKGPAE
jgi:hypothetical protein